MPVTQFGVHVMDRFRIPGHPGNRTADLVRALCGARGGEGVKGISRRGAKKLTREQKAEMALCVVCEARLS